MANAAAQGSASPSSSPRLPSPPPFPEVQIGPKSPAIGVPGDIGAQDIDALALDNDATRRIRPGTKAADMAAGPPLIPLAELDSPFQLQEHLKALYLDVTKSADNSGTVPVTRETATLLATPPENVDRALWLYELCRFLVQKANALIVGFFSDNPPCSAKDCPEMRASEWQYLCAVHDPPKSCCAIDYCCHTLDWAANTLTSPKHFASRLTLGPAGGDGTNSSGGSSSSQASVRQLTNILRRVYRMFAHAWFQHRDVFWSLENQEGLYIFYKTVCDVYQLIPEDNYTVPPEAEGIKSTDHSNINRDEASKDLPVLLEKRASVIERGATATPQPEQNNTAQITASIGATTRRHKQTPSIGSFVTTIAEGDEDSEVATGGEDQRGSTDIPITVRRDRSISPPKRPIPVVRTHSPEQVSEKVLSEETEKASAVGSEDVQQVDSPEPDEAPASSTVSKPFEEVSTSSHEEEDTNVVSGKDEKNEDLSEKSSGGLSNEIASET